MPWWMPRICVASLIWRALARAFDTGFCGCPKRAAPTHRQRTTAAVSTSVKARRVRMGCSLFPELYVTKPLSSSGGPELGDLGRKRPERHGQFVQGPEVRLGVLVQQADQGVAPQARPDP